MSLRKILAPALCSLCAVSLLVPAAFAHGCRGGYARRSTAQPCGVEDCTVTGWHYHNGTAYCGHTHGDGLCGGTCAPLCPVKDCTLAGRHLHDGVVYCGANHVGGYCDGTCAPLCPVKDCTLVGRHLHDGVVYCGANHADGYCNGACQATAQSSGSGGYRGGCHGGGCRAN